MLITHWCFLYTEQCLHSIRAISVPYSTHPTPPQYIGWRCAINWERKQPRQVTWTSWRDILCCTHVMLSNKKRQGGLGRLHIFWSETGWTSCYPWGVVIAFSSLVLFWSLSSSTSPLFIDFLPFVSWTTGFLTFSSLFSLPLPTGSWVWAEWVRGCVVFSCPLGLTHKRFIIYRFWLHSIQNPAIG